MQDIEKWELVFSLLTELRGHSCAAPAEQRAQRPSRGRRYSNPEKAITVTSRHVLLAGFQMATGGNATEASIYKHLHVDFADWKRWKRGELPNNSAITERIETFLRKHGGQFSAPH